MAADVEQALAGALDDTGGRGGRVLVDGTLGLAGHSIRLLAARPGLRLIGVDRDPQALDLAAGRIAAAGLTSRCDLVQATFDDLDAIGAAVGSLANGVDAVLLDLGVSSFQLDTDDRGFAYSRDTPLDMRMSRSGPTAADVLNTYPARRLETAFREYGDERFARQIAAAIVRARETAPLATTGDLVEIVYATVPAPARRTGGHPAKRVFQALRIEVNDELGSLRRALAGWPSLLRVGGRMAVISYHSGEDRLVKRAFAALSTVEVPPGLPVEPPPAPFRLAVRGSVQPPPDEVAGNPRAASARLRVIERVTDQRPDDREQEVGT